MNADDLPRRIPPFLSLEKAAVIFERDLASLCDAELVQVLTEAQKIGSHPIAGALGPLARRELARRRAANPPLPRSLPEDFPSSRS